MGNMDHVAAVGRKAIAISGALDNGDIEGALCGHHPRVIRGDFSPLTKKQAVKAVVAYLADLRGVSARVNSYDKGLITVYLGDIKLLIQVNPRENEVFNQKTIVINVVGRDIEHGKLSRSVGSKFFNKVWLSAPVKKRGELAKKNGV